MKFSVVKLPSALVARMCDAVGGGGFEVEQGAIGYADHPVELLIAKRPPALLSSE